MSDKTIMSVEELSAWLKVPKTWIYSRVKETATKRGMPCFHIGKYLRFYKEDIESWINQSEDEREMAREWKQGDADRETSG